MGKIKAITGVPTGYMVVKDATKPGPKVPIDRGPTDLKVIKKTVPPWGVDKKYS